MQEKSKKILYLREENFAAGRQSRLLRRNHQSDDTEKLEHVLFQFSEMSRQCFPGKFGNPVFRHESFVIEAARTVNRPAVGIGFRIGKVPERHTGPSFIAPDFVQNRLQKLRLILFRPAQPAVVARQCGGSDFAQNDSFAETAGHPAGRTSRDRR